MPNDIQDQNYVKPTIAHGFTRSGLGYSRLKIVPHQADRQQTANILNAGSKVAILIGAGARDAAVKVTEFAELLGAGVAKALLGKEELPYDLPYVTGAIGLLHTEPSWQLMQDCDILFMIGTSFPWVEFLWADGEVKAA